MIRQPLLSGPGPSGSSSSPGRQSPAGGGGNAGRVPPQYLCPITSELMMDPVIAADGHTYEREAISQWFNECRKRPSGTMTSPMTNEQLPNVDLRSNISLRQLISDWQDMQSTASASPAPTQSGTQRVMRVLQDSFSPSTILQSASRPSVDPSSQQYSTLRHRRGFKDLSFTAILLTIALAISVALSASLDIGQHIARWQHIGREASHAQDNGYPPTWILCHALLCGFVFAVFVEGCSRQLKQNHWPPLLQSVGGVIWYSACVVAALLIPWQTHIGSADVFFSAVSAAGLNLFCVVGVTAVIAARKRVLRLARSTSQAARQWQMSSASNGSALGAMVGLVLLGASVMCLVDMGLWASAGGRDCFPLAVLPIAAGGVLFLALLQELVLVCKRQERTFEQAISYGSLVCLWTVVQLMSATRTGLGTAAFTNGECTLDDESRDKGQRFAAMVVCSVTDAAAGLLLVWVVFREARRLSGATGVPLNSASFLSTRMWWILLASSGCFITSYGCWSFAIWRGDEEEQLRVEGMLAVRILCLGRVVAAFIAPFCWFCISVHA